MQQLELPTNRSFKASYNVKRTMLQLLSTKLKYFCPRNRPTKLELSANTSTEAHICRDEFRRKNASWREEASNFLPHE
uniref:Uncharacterized protein n=1 Tax=Tetraselmis sp. GSL018 TaxID=582737 RepID=A0A061QQ10_9CHLO